MKRYKVHVEWSGFGGDSIFYLEAASTFVAYPKVFDYLAAERNERVTHLGYKHDAETIKSITIEENYSGG